MLSTTLPLCLQTADRVEVAADRLGRSWPGHAPIMQTCRQFRQSCEQLASNRGLSDVTIAFVGPKKAGKSTLAGLLVQSEEKRQRIKAGRSTAAATTKPTWISAQPPTLLDTAHEEFIPCHESEFVPLGFQYSLLDVPGFDEGNAVRGLSAISALDNAGVKVLVVDRRSLESHESIKYLGRADGATVVPVINLIRDEEQSADFNAFEDRLRHSLPHTRVLDRIEVRDYEVVRDRDGTLAAAGQALAKRLGEAVAGQSIETLAEPQLEEKLRGFKSKIAALAGEHLPGSRDPVLELAAALQKMPAQAVEELLGTARLVSANVSARFRSLLLERTPIFVFPWRLALSIANLIHGATDRLPLALLGSPVSILTTAWATVKNVKNAHEFGEKVSSGFHNDITGRIKALAIPKLEAIDYALQRDLGLASGHAPRTGITSAANLRGLDILQTRSTELFQVTIEKYAPSRALAWLLGIVGVALFWSIFGWPVFGLYQDFQMAAQEVLARKKTSLEAFPAGTFSMLVTSAILAVLPMGFALLGVIEFLTRKSKVCACVTELRAVHKAEIDLLTATGLLAAELTEPQIDAIRLLLTLERTQNAL